MTAVQVSGLGAVCASGLDKNEIFRACSESRSAVGDDGLASLNETQWQSLLALTPEPLRASKNTILGYAALKSALDEAGWTAAQIAESGFVFSSTTSQIDQWENHLPYYKKPDHDKRMISSSVANQSLGTPAIKLMEHFGVKGPLSMVASSCSASLQAVAMGVLMIRAGRVKRVIVGAAEIQSDLTRVGFGSLRLLSKTPCKPFDQGRTGINLGEGSAFLCLEAAPASSNKTSPWGYVTGLGLASDAYHPTAPHPEGQGSRRALEQSLTDARLQAADIDWIYAHGTGSPANDLAESIAIAKFFPHAPPVTSTKACHGHTLAASGSLEAVIGLVAMKSGTVLPTTNLTERDPKIAANVGARALSKNIKHFAKNSLGFGGINASVIFSREVAP